VTGDKPAPRWRPLQGDQGASRTLRSYSPLVEVTHRFQIPCPHCAALGTVGYVPQFAFDAARLAQAILAFTPHHHFTARQLMLQANVRMHPEYLRVALLGFSSPVQLGLALKQIEGVDFGGFCIRRDNKENNAILWRIYEGSPGHPKVLGGILSKG